MLNVGLIGYRNHAGRLARLIEARADARLGCVYHPELVPPHPAGTSDFDRLLAMDAIMVASPNHTHAGYLERLATAFDGYVFCEKPVVATRAELERLRLHPERTFFNFNYRFGRFAELVRDALADGSLGQPIELTVCTAQGLAFKPGYETSWRADAARHRNGIAETKAIHHVDFAVHAFGPPNEWRYQPRNVSGRGSAFDTCHIHLRHANGAMVNILASYAAPLTTFMQMIGDNGRIEYRGDVLSRFTPRDTFDANGYFAPPPETVVRDYRGSDDDIYTESLARAVGYFLDVCARGEAFPAAQFDASMATTRLMFDLADSVKD